MNKSLLPLRSLWIAAAMCVGVLSAQQVSDGRYALPEQLAPLPKGDLMSFPKKISSQTFRHEFSQPPRGYGNVPFYWWSGDQLSKEKLKYELDILKQSPLDGFAVSYIHTHPKADRNSEFKGSGMFGATEPGRPGVMTPEWYDYWKWFSAECAKENIGLGLDDYTFAWIGNGYYPDEIRDLDRMKRYQGQLEIVKTELNGGDLFTPPHSPTRLSCRAWPVGKEGESIDVTNRWTAPEGKWVVYDVSTKANYMLEPSHGAELVDRYFQRIENKLTPEERKGTNYYFQDELGIPLDLHTWSEDFTEVFRRTKGYDITPYLGALSGDIGRMTEKVRLDYADVLMTLAEERYFKPIFDWHWNRGLIYGSDNLSRGGNPIQYVDYFRATRWFSAPGNDAPARGSSLMNTKVSSSISHLYDRPRTWLEAFHSMGWGSSGEWLTTQLDHHLIGGGNLLCLHGLYYSTRGGWWEWAPPDFHYRMPYWDHMKYWLTYAQRMSYVLSQGSHVCDVAMVYPTEAMQAVAGKSGKMAFESGKQLIYSGVDFDFIDYQSTARAEIKGKELSVTKENYQVLVLADLPAVHHATLEKALAFYRSGGVVVAIGELPYASTLEGRSDRVDAMVKELFGVTATELKEGKTPSIQQSKAGGRGIYTSPEKLASTIKQQITPDFNGGGEAKVLHRRVDNTDLYMVMNIAPGAELFFRSTGKAELWDAASGTIRDLPVIQQNEQGTTLRLDNSFDRSYLVVFTQGEKPQFATAATASLSKANAPTHQVAIEGEWETELVPTMNNQFGDFRLPIREAIIGAEARTFRTPADPTNLPKNWYTTDFCDAKWDTLIYGYGTQGRLAFTASSDYTSFAAKAKQGDVAWKPYHFSWQYGVWEQPGNQGYHGLKGKVDDQFIILGDSGHYAFTTYLYAPRTTKYTPYIEGTQPAEVWVNNQLVSGELTLSQGWHKLLVLYRDIQKGKHTATHEMYDERSRSAVLFIPTDQTVPKPYSRYDEKLAMRWEACNQRTRFNPHKDLCKAYPFRFTAAPGLKGLEVSAFASKLSIWVDGEIIPAKNITTVSTDDATGLNVFHITLPTPKPHASVVAMQATALPGYADAAILPYPVRMECGKGLMTPCNWGEVGELRHYSGGIWYRKHITITPEMVGKEVTIDLGSVVATCEIHVNGQKCGILLNSPFTMDISKQLKAGENHIEVLVYSTLSNHYQTIPTPRHYRGDATAGMIGPVKLVVR